MTRLVLVLIAAACHGRADPDDGVDTDDSAPIPDDTEPVDSPDDTERPDTDDAPIRCPRDVPPPALPAVTPPARAFRVQALSPAIVEALVVEDLDRDGHVDVAMLVGSGDLALDVRFGGATSGRLGPSVRLDRASMPVNAPIAGLAPHDLDDDGDLDLLVGTTAGVIAAELDAGAFTWHPSVVAPWPDGLVDPWNKPVWLALVDLDGDGVLDLLEGVSGAFLRDDGEGGLEAAVSLPADELVPASVWCFRGAGDGTFVPGPAGLCPSPVLPEFAQMSFGAGVADLDGDGAPEVALINDFGRNVFLRGTGSGLVAHPRSGLDVYNQGMGVGVSDFDGDGLRDVFVSDVGPNSLYLASDDDCLRFFDAVGPSGLQDATARVVTWGVVAQDLDHNGAPDLLVSQSAEFGPDDPLDVGGLADLRLPYPPSLLLLNDGRGLFSRTDVPDTRDGGPALFWSNVLAHGDLDADGDVDGVLATRYTTSILWNELPKAGAAITVAVHDDRGRPAIGARVVVRQPSGSRRVDLWPSSSQQGTSQLVAHVGLAVTDEPVTVEVRWPDGRQAVRGPFTAPFPDPWSVTVTPPEGPAPSP